MVVALPAAIRAAQEAIKIVELARQISQLRKEAQKLRKEGFDRQARQVERCCDRAQKEVNRMDAVRRKRSRRARTAPRDSRGRFG